MWSPEMLAMYAVVACIGLPAAWFNRTAAALVFAWALGFLIWLLTGENLPTGLYFITDVMVIATILTKPDAEDCWPYNGLREQFAALWKERCRWDKVVVAVFFIMWLIYIVDIPEQYRYWSLWALVIIQFLAAGDEAVSVYRKRREATDKPALPGVMKLGLAGHG
jgi:hypothetical protein